MNLDDIQAFLLVAAVLDGPAAALGGGTFCVAGRPRLPLPLLPRPPRPPLQAPAFSSAVGFPAWTASTHSTDPGTRVGVGGGGGLIE